MEGNRTYIRSPASPYVTPAASPSNSFTQPGRRAAHAWPIQQLSQKAAWGGPTQPDPNTGQPAVSKPSLGHHVVLTVIRSTVVAASPSVACSTRSEVAGACVPPSLCAVSERSDTNAQCILTLVWWWAAVHQDTTIWLCYNTHSAFQCPSSVFVKV